MLPPNFFDIAADDILELYSELDKSILRDIVRRLIKTGGITSTAAWQAQQLQESGLLMRDITAMVSQMSGASDKQVEALFNDAGVKALEYDMAIYEAAGLTPLPIKQSPTAAAVLKAGINKTAGNLKNLSMTTAVATQQAYIAATTLAEMQVESGAFDYVTAIRNAVRNASKLGSVVSYPSGHKDLLDVAIRRATLTGVSQTASQLSIHYADDTDCDLVETTAHPGARPEHAIWQGKVFSRSGHSKKYPDFATNTRYGYGDGLCGWNCRHSFYPYFEGLSSCAYPREKISEYNNKTVTYNDQKIGYYNATQMQRNFERKIRATKRELAGYDEGTKASDEKIRNAMKEDFNAASVKLKKQEAQLKDFVNKTGLDRQREREQVLGFGRSAAQKARQSAEKHYQTWVHDIGANNSAPETLAKYYKEKYNNSPAFELLKGYNKAIKCADISPLVGLKQYTEMAHEVESRLLGVTTSTGIEIQSYATHFIDRIIGQVSTPHPGKRSGVSIEDAKDALIHPQNLGTVRNMADGDIRQTFYGNKATVAISVRDKRLIQTNPR